MILSKKVIYFHFIHSLPTGKLVNFVSQISEVYRISYISQLVFISHCKMRAVTIFMYNAPYNVNAYFC